jgi:hypothetical protein
MLDNPNTENAPLDAEDWAVAFTPYAQYPILALTLAQHLTALQDYIQREPLKATAAINRAVESLYEHSEFRSVFEPQYRERSPLNLKT